MNLIWKNNPINSERLFSKMKVLVNFKALKSFCVVKAYSYRSSVRRLRRENEVTLSEVQDFTYSCGTQESESKETKHFIICAF